jgi:hypothetical protein
VVVVRHHSRGRVGSRGNGIDAGVELTMGIMVWREGLGVSCAMLWWLPIVQSMG